MNREVRFDNAQPCRLMLDFPDVYAMNDFVVAMKVMGVLFEDCVLCHAGPEDFNKKAGGVPRSQMAVLISNQRYEVAPNKRFKLQVPGRNVQ